MTVLEFIEQAHPDTIKWIERELMDKLGRVDYLNKMNQAVREVREACKEVV
jgi:hypothetical protein